MKGPGLMNCTTGYDTVQYVEPLGVFAGIAPWNFPAMIPHGWMAPLCIATGNTFVLKAASFVPQSAIRILELWLEAGLPKGVFNLVTCGRNEAEILLRHPSVAGISFVGSTGVGRHIYATAAANGKRVQALCEAKNHALVLKDSNLKRTAMGIMNATCGCAGERCMALPVVVAEESIADELVGLINEFMGTLKVGPAYDQTSQLGPVVNQGHKEFVTKWIETGIKEGAKLVRDGRGLVVPGYEKGFYVGPTLFDHVTPGMSVGDKEIFGPVCCVKRVKGFEEGLALMNANEFANGSVIYTQNGYYAREFVRRTHGGHDRGERRHRGTDGVFPVRRRGSLDVRRHQGPRAGDFPLLHGDECRHRAVAVSDKDPVFAGVTGSSTEVRIAPDPCLGPLARRMLTAAVSRAGNVRYPVDPPNVIRTMPLAH